MVAVLSFPFRIGGNGSAVTVEQDTDDQYAELLAALIMTRPGERPLVPGFGTPDPTFVGLDIAALEGAATVFGPPVTISDVTVTITGVSSQDVVVEFDS